ncbi:chemotaxis protein CheW [Microcoleus sp. FACHB-68]|uniref:chemotaxis protein CheW n=1 Tax=Microcoleus sp. FACHB-68 TaxID=2692826 RepID=UPI0016837F4A|nr:chemotaxis protein CheW [Microcoleus sp. FACHB-68]MBD1936621.1 chemotaxis protein CheW [Microcoleus sp. FACHB-68]
MENKSYLIFELNGSRYGVEAFCVQEIFFLPELTPITDAPRDIVGVVNLRGNIVPIMDLEVRLGHRTREFQLSDSVIILDLQGFQIGIIVNQVQEVLDLVAEEVSTELLYGRKISDNSHNFLSGVAKMAGGIVMLLNAKNLVYYSDTVEALIPEKIPKSAQETEAFLATQRVFCPHATPEERAIFRLRAENLMLSTSRQDFAGLTPLAVIGLNGEYFGFELELVREFTDLRKITPIPCTPAHIIGNMNLRGEIITIIDIRSLLNLSVAGSSTNAKAMVIHVDDLVAGVTVDEVFDVMYLQPSDMRPVPAAVHSSNDEYLRGTAPYREKMMSILDMSKIITKGELIVNEEI